MTVSKSPDDFHWHLKPSQVSPSYKVIVQLLPLFLHNKLVKEYHFLKKQNTNNSESL